jgi:hypothetical protein
MTDVVLISCLWVLAGTITALLPMRYQYVPGTVLLLAAPVLIVWLAADYGWWVGLIGLFALLSMFRRPLVYYYRVFRGLEVDAPE